MKKTMRKFLLLAGMFVFAISANAQNSSISACNSDEFVLGDFWSNWYVSGSLGANIPVHRNSAQYLDLNPSFAYSLSVGKWVTPNLSIRAGFSRSSLNGYDYSNGSHTITGTSELDGSFSVLRGDVMLNLSSLIWGYKEDRFYQFMPYMGAGIGIIKGSSDTKNTAIYKAVPTIGFVNDFRINNSFSIICDINASLLKGSAYGSASNNKVMPINATVGVTYTFGKEGRHFNTVTGSKCYAALNSKITELNNEIKNLKSQNVTTEKEVKNIKTELKKAQETAISNANTAPQIEYCSSPVAIFFKINESTLSEQDIARLKYVAEGIKEQPNAKFTVKGYADSATGTASFNQKLSEKRAEAVCKVLVDKYGISSSQLEPIGMGAVSDKFEKSYLNRFALIQSK